MQNLFLEKQETTQFQNEIKLDKLNSKKTLTI